MRSPCKRPTATYDYLLGVLTTITIPLVAFRVLYAAGLFPITDAVLNAGTSIGTVLFMSATFGLAWRRSILHGRAERAELIALIGELEKRVSETENAVWWGTPQAPEDERTVEPDPTVVAFRHRKSS